MPHRCFALQFFCFFCSSSVSRWWCWCDDDRIGRVIEAIRFCCSCVSKFELISMEQQQQDAENVFNGRFYVRWNASIKVLLYCIAYTMWSCFKCLESAKFPPVTNKSIKLCPFDVDAFGTTKSTVDYVCYVSPSQFSSLERLSRFSKQLSTSATNQVWWWLRMREKKNETKNMHFSKWNSQNVLWPFIARFLLSLLLSLPLVVLVAVLFHPSATLKRLNTNSHTSVKQ